ncbi:hypothetical protein CMV_015981 [Castanea mollissima]|uniref:Nudix hydrolase domain-containing protein n=1 Tax=Castanea mollissima TaxID=60419 RepID=A0A8J4QVJ9_9ROSI|nr:hypothetical protein CMV_015981 [Castanea mollissima]
MDSSSSSSSGSKKLVALAQQLRLYKATPTMRDLDEQILEENVGKVVSQVGFAESATPIAQQDPQSIRAHKTQKKAAVLICLFEGDNGDLRVILTKRSSNLSTHSGEVALPGGKAEEGDKDDGDTATREAKEEIGLDPSLVNVVTSLEPFLSKHLLRVVPVIGILNEKKAFKPAPNPDEVEAVFDAPLEMFIKGENRRTEENEWMGHNCVQTATSFSGTESHFQDRRRQLALGVKEISAVSKLSEQRSWSHPLHHCSGPDLKNKEPIWLLINTIDKLISIKNFSS